MIVREMIDRFLSGVKGQAMRAGTQYALEARVGDFIGTVESVSSVVRGRSGDFEVALWAEYDRLDHRCTCPSWREPCKHEVAAALVLRQCLLRGPVETRKESRQRSSASAAPTIKMIRAPGSSADGNGNGDGDGGGRGARGNGAQDGGARGEAPGRGTRRKGSSSLVRAVFVPEVVATGAPAAAPLASDADAVAVALEKVDPEDARRRALEERVVAARREKLLVKLEGPPLLRIESPSGFAYRVLLRGGPEGSHSCDCPDFEANRLHTCKHVERARAYLRSARSRIPGEHRKAAARPRIYLHFGEVVEPRLFGTPTGEGSRAVRSAFDDQGLPLRPLARDEAELRRWLATFGAWVEPQALSWLDRRLEARPDLPKRKLASLLPSLGLTPYPYQWTGAAFLASTGRALLADEMGLGKTAQAILAAAALRKAPRPAEAVTIVCPASLRGGWQDEIRRWLGEDATLLEGQGPERARVITSRPRWLITHYEQVLRDHEHHRACPPDLLIVDEAQRAKGLRTRTARVLKSIGARYIFALTGTPLENRLEEAYAIAQLIDQRLLPPLWQIDRDHFVRDDTGRRVVFYRGLDALRSRLAPAFLRRRKEDVALDLPERLRSVVMVDIHPAVVSTYDDVIGQVAIIASKKVILPADLDRMQRLLVIARRCCNGPHMLGLKFDDRKVPKLQELEEALRDLCLGEGRKAVVFSEWTDMTERVVILCDRLRLPAFHLNGDVPVRRRPALIRAFNDTNGAAVFVSTDAGGVGLNLQAADVVINLDLPWNPARLEQRIARVHRIGSKHAVQEILLVTKESIEHRILALHETKRNVLENIWAKTGEDVIAAPGGSGAFREMVRALLAARAPVAPGGDVTHRSAAPAAVVGGGGALAGLASSHAVLGAGSWVPVGPSTDAVEAVVSPGTPASLVAEAPPELDLQDDGKPGSPSVEARRAQQVAGIPPAIPSMTAGESPSVRSSLRGPEPVATVGARDAGTPSPPPSGPSGPSVAAAVSVDPVVLSAAVRAIAPSLPHEHRSSLAAVFRALAQALEAP